MRKWLILVGFVALIVGSTACSRISGKLRSEAASTKEQGDKGEEYAVYSVILDQLYVQRGAVPVILAPQTSLDWVRGAKLSEDLDLVREATGGSMTQDVVDNFQNGNRYPRLLENRFDPKVKCILLSQEEVEAITQSNWNSFLTKYPYQSLITLSRIGFNREMNQALLYTGKESGGKSGRGEFIFLIKESNAWVVKKRVASWVS